MHDEKTLLQLQEAILFEYELVEIIVFSSDRRLNHVGLGKREDLLSNRTHGHIEQANCGKAVPTAGS